ncbi:MAG: hypothetical protein KBS52_01990 [Clostridiales bacterium]|nr:hypothetical protein [Candidatus Equinaster intestinalis]
MYNNNHDYDSLIRKLKKRKNATKAIAVILVVLILICTGSHEVVIMDEIVWAGEGLNPLSSLALSLAVIFCEYIVLGIIQNSVNEPISKDCDPEKHIILSQALNGRNTDYIYATDLFYLGEIEKALPYAEKMISNRKKIFAGLFNKARCEFFMGDYDSLKATIGQYENELLGRKKLNNKTKAALTDMLRVMKLLALIADKDTEKLASYKDIQPWNSNKLTAGYTNYLKGLAARIVGDTEDAVYRFMFVKDNCSKTVLASWATEQLAELKNND